MSANPLRGETAFAIAERLHTLRPSFAALVAAEEELGSLLALAARAAEGGLRIAEIAALIWYCIAEDERPSRDAVGEAVARQGLVAATVPLRQLLTEILKGAG